MKQSAEEILAEKSYGRIKDARIKGINYVHLKTNKPSRFIRYMKQSDMNKFH